MVLVPPPSISEMIDQAAVGSPAALASASRTAEANDGRELGPVDRVKPAMLATDRHRLCTLLLRSSGKDPTAWQKGQPFRPHLDRLCTSFLACGWRIACLSLR